MLGKPTLPTFGMETAPQSRNASFFGHPSGLATLFFTEMWERFSYYGMRALLILFMTASAEQGGLGFNVSKASAIYGLYTAMVYMLSLPGGWLGDRFLGLRRAVLWGGILIAAGHYSLAIPRLPFFYLGLALIVAGTGLLKPNVSAIVGRLYPQGDARRDAGFSIFYMGINLGAFIAPLAVGYVGQRVDWHLGFGLSGLGMTFGVLQYLLGSKHLGEAGLNPAKPQSAEEQARQKRQLRWGLAGFAALVAVPAVLYAAGLLQLSVQALSGAFGLLLLLTVVVSFAGLLFFGHWTPVERKRLVAIAVLFVASVLFWSVFEQAGSTLSLFAERSTDKQVGGYSFPASWFQSVNALLIIVLAPVFAWVWVKLGSRNPSSPAKFSLGLIFAGLGFAVMASASTLAATGAQVSAMWLITTYLLHTIGELCLSPVGLSAMTKLAPTRVSGLIMGIWFLSISVGNYLGARVAALYEALPLLTLFGTVAVFAIVSGLLLAVFAKPIKNLIGGAD